ncbi:MAG TPA: rhomboid family intramembrane serine protease [Sandaracinaceae bacterium LLY-WYZ-13_1]|nr:rhomboid family intramembrane serine protease [Sandaracinaceae bacterium LLY-WYZ-13_1]
MARGRSRGDKSWAVIGVSALLAAVFVVDSVVGLGLARRWALFPSTLVRAFETLRADPGAAAAWATVGSVWTSVLVHADLGHLASNVAFFWFFGTLLAQIAGNRWVVATFLLTSLSSGLAFVVQQTQGGAGGAVIGTSGAISGVAGLYVLLAFRWDVPDAHAWPLARPIPPAQAALVGVLAAAMDVYMLRQGLASGVAFAAHVGGFAGGLVLGALLTTFYPTWERFQRSPLGSRVGA